MGKRWKGSSLVGTLGHPARFQHSALCLRAYTVHQGLLKLVQQEVLGCMSSLQVLRGECHPFYSRISRLQERLTRTFRSGALSLYAKSPLSMQNLSVQTILGTAPRTSPALSNGAETLRLNGTCLVENVSCYTLFLSEHIL